VFATQKIDAIVYPTASRKPPLIAAPPPPANPTAILADMGLSATDIANLTGFPDLIVPAGFTGDNLPVGLSFFGPAFSESKLLALGYSFEQATHARRLPVHTPPRAGEKISVR
jgi:amidase